MQAIEPCLRVRIVRNECLAQVQHAGQIDIDHELPILGRDIHQFERLGNAGVINENVDLAEGCDSLFGGLATIGEVADVAANSDVVRAEFLGRSLGRGGIQIQDGDPGSLFGEKSRCGAAYPARACRP
jgi:hypothetical protein